MASGDAADSINAFHRLARPDDSSAFPVGRNSTHHTNDAVLNGNSSFVSSSTSLLEGLPAEMLALVLAEGNISKQDMLSLGSCSQTLWEHVSRHSQEDCRKLDGLWAGVPLIAPSNRIQDLPQAIYDVFPEVKERHRQWMAGEVGRYGKCPARSWISDLFRKGVEVVDRRRHWLEAGQKLPQPFKSNFEKSLCMTPAKVGEQWMLRNLTTSEYARLEVTDGDSVKAQAAVAGSKMLSLDEVLFCKICWSKDHSSSHQLHENASFMRGEWAGHSFDVIRGAHIEGWRDVTDTMLHQATVPFGELGGYNTETSNNLRLLVDNEKWWWWRVSAWMGTQFSHWSNKLGIQAEAVRLVQIETLFHISTTKYRQRNAISARCIFGDDRDASSLV